MSSPRKQILDWARQGLICESSLPEALRCGDAEPCAARWRDFIDRLLLWCGSLFMAAGVIFFFAFNWQHIGRFAKFALVESLLLAGVLACRRLGPDRLSGKAALFFSSLTVGALPALVGQTYQTGADPWQLFALWALLILPWVALGRFAPLLLFWIALINLALVLYHQAFPLFGILGILLGRESLLWFLFAFNSLMLLLWELAAARGLGWLKPRWAPRILALAGGTLMTTLTLWAVLDDISDHPYHLAAYLGWSAVLYAAYRRRMRDLFVLSGWVLSLIIVAAALLARTLLQSQGGAGALLLIGLLVISLSAFGARWLKSLAREQTP